MFRATGPAMLAAVALSVGVLTGPGAAYAADPRTSLTAAQMAADLKSVNATTLHAARPGWRGTMSVSGAGIGLTSKYVADPAHGIAMDREIVPGLLDETEYAVSGVGVYAYAGNRTSRKAMAMIGRPSVRWVLTPSKLKLSTWMRDTLTPPSEVLTEDVAHAGRRTTHDDGSADYVFTEEGTTETLHVDPNGVLTSLRASGGGVDAHLVFAYGAQHLTRPAASATVSRATMDLALAYLDMPSLVSGVADAGAHDARAGAKGRTVSVAAVRKAVRRNASLANKEFKATVVRVTDIRNGAHVSATNPWTHRTVTFTFTVTASGRKVVVAG